MKAILQPDGILIGPTLIPKADRRFPALLDLYHDHEIVCLSDGYKVPPGYGGHPWLKGTPEFGKSYQIPLEHLHVEPGKLQYKQGADKETGVATELDHSAFDPELCGELSVWKNPRDGKTYVVDGHHRRELGEQAGCETLPCKYIEAKNFAEAKRIGKALNGYKDSDKPGDWSIKPHGESYGLFRNGRMGPVAVGHPHELANRIARPNRTQPDPTGPHNALAQDYASHWNAAKLTPEHVGEHELATVHDELADGSAILNWDGERWHVVPAGVSLSVHRAPRGGISINGKFFKGGTFIPGPEYAKATPEQQDAINHPKEEREKARRAKGNVDTRGLYERLKPHAHHELTEHEKTSAKRSLNALHAHHGELTVHRLEEIAEQLQQAHDEAEDEGQKLHFSRRLKQVEHQLGLAKSKGIHGNLEKGRDEMSRAEFSAHYAKRVPHGMTAREANQHPELLKAWRQSVVDHYFDEGEHRSVDRRMKHWDKKSAAYDALVNAVKKERAEPKPEPMPSAASVGKPDDPFGNTKKDDPFGNAEYEEDQPKALIPLDDSKAIAARIHEAGRKLHSMFGHAHGSASHKVFLSDVYDAVKDDIAGDLTLTDFKRLALKLHKQGDLNLKRLDLVAGVHRDERYKIAHSAVNWQGEPNDDSGSASFHAVDVPTEEKHEKILDKPEKDVHGQPEAAKETAKAESGAKAMSEHKESKWIENRKGMYPNLDPAVLHAAGDMIQRDAEGNVDPESIRKAEQHVIKAAVQAKFPDPPLATLAGSEKQISFATTVRSKLITQLNNALGVLESRAAVWRSEKAPATRIESVEKDQAILVKRRNAVASQTNAGKILDAKDTNLADLSPMVADIINKKAGVA